jgi:hypothetical protein
MQLPKNKSNRKAVVLTADKFEDMEVFFPVFRLLEEGWQRPCSFFLPFFTVFL